MKAYCQPLLILTWPTHWFLLKLEVLRKAFVVKCIYQFLLNHKITAITAYQRGYMTWFHMSCQQSLFSWHRWLSFQIYMWIALWTRWEPHPRHCLSQPRDFVTNPRSYGMKDIPNLLESFIPRWNRKSRWTVTQSCSKEMWSMWTKCGMNSVWKRSKKRRLFLSELPLCDFLKADYRRQRAQQFQKLYRFSRLWNSRSWLLWMEQDAAFQSKQV